MAFSGFGTGSTFGAPSTTPTFGATANPFAAALGAPATTTTSLFGATTPSPFGTSTTSTANPFAAALGAPSTTSSLFGATTPAPTTSPFGAPTSTATPSFFTPTSTSTTTPSLFGSSMAAPATPSFGAFGTTNPTATTTPSLFGSMAAPTTPSLFSNTTSTTPLFSATPFNPTSTFGQPAQPQTPQLAQPAQQTPLQKLDALHSCFNPAHPQCKFRHMFYNQINANPEEIRRMNSVRPANVDQLLWDQACRNNPDPSRFVPVQACGFDDLKARIAEQNKLTGQQTQTLQDATKLIDYIKHQHTNNTMAKFGDYKQKQLDITQKLIRVICKLMVLEARGSRLTTGEEQMKRKLELILQDLSSPFLYQAKIEDFIAKAKITTPTVLLPQFDEKTLEQITKALKEQRGGLEVLTAMVQKDSKDVQIMLNDLGA